MERQNIVVDQAQRRSDFSFNFLEATGTGLTCCRNIVEVDSTAIVAIVHSARQRMDTAGCRDWQG